MQISIRNERRLRLHFHIALGAGAFTSTSYYSIASVDSGGVSPTVSAALIVPNSPEAVELVLADDLADGDLYEITVTSIPISGPSTFTETTRFRTGSQHVSVNKEPEVNDIDQLLYGRDLVHSGVDFVEDVSGDLAEVSGVENGQGALRRRCFSNGLPYDPTYGAHPEEYVDGAEGEMPTLRGALIEQCFSDDRVRDVTVDFATDEEGQAVFSIVAELVGKKRTQPIEVKP